jgi:DNA-binding NarL/FixJ family response regulator
METQDTQNTTCKILFIEDKVLDVKMMRRELDRAHFKYVSLQVTSRKEFLDALINFKPDIILSDYSLPTFNGMHAFRLFKERHIFIPFILVTGTLSDELSLECLSEGIDDFILKSQFNRLPSLIARHIEIKRLASENILILDELNRKNEELSRLNEKTKKEKVLELLSAREFEILCLIASGVSIKEIAAKLFLSPATIATYRARLLEKLDINSNVGLTRYAIDNNLIE